jgi:pSer/pThr/pTyr-binding forkhead associated (FHA) protein
MAELCLLDENGAVTRRWEIGDQPLAIGRDETADVLVSDDTLSRRHFLIWREEQNFLIKDLESQNGTWVDGQRAEGSKLSHNVCIVAGRSVFIFCEHGHQAGAAPPHAAVVLPAVLAAQSAGAPNPAPPAS